MLLLAVQNRSCQKLWNELKKVAKHAHPLVESLQYFKIIRLLLIYKFVIGSAKGLCCAVNRESQAMTSLIFCFSLLSKPPRRGMLHSVKSKRPL